MLEAPIVTQNPIEVEAETDTTLPNDPTSLEEATDVETKDVVNIEVTATEQKLRAEADKQKKIDDIRRAVIMLNVAEARKKQAAKAQSTRKVTLEDLNAMPTEPSFDDKQPKERIAKFRKQEEFGAKKFIKPCRTGTKSQQQIPPRGQKGGARGGVVAGKK